MPPLRVDLSGASLPGSLPLADQAVARVGPGLSQIAAASARSRSGASTEPRYSPLLRIMMTRQLRRLAGLSSKTFRPLKTPGLFPQPEAAVCRRERHHCDAETDYYHSNLRPSPRRRKLQDTNCVGCRLRALLSRCLRLLRCGLQARRPCGCPQRGTAVVQSQDLATWLSTNVP
jgi:hypothetical protein